jgi:hypothetical protein
MKPVLAAAVATFVTLAALISNYHQALPRLEELEQTHRRHLPALANAVRVVTNAVWPRKGFAPCGTPGGSDRTHGKSGPRAAQFSGRHRYETRQSTSRLYRRDADGTMRFDCSRKFKALFGSSTISLPPQSAPKVFLKRQARLAKKMTAAADANVLTDAAALPLTS